MPSYIWNDISSFVQCSFDIIVVKFANSLDKYTLFSYLPKPVLRR